MNPKKLLRQKTQQMRDHRYINSLLEQHTDEQGCTDMVSLNEQLHEETKNPTMEQFFNNIINHA